MGATAGIRSLMSPTLLPSSLPTAMTLSTTVSQRAWASLVEVLATGHAYRPPMLPRAPLSGPAPNAPSNTLQGNLAALSNTQAAMWASQYQGIHIRVVQGKRLITGFLQGRKGS